MFSCSEYILLILLLILPITVCAGQGSEKTGPASTFTLWQLPEQTRTQMMSYVIRTTGDQIIVIDGGMPGDAPFLKDFLSKLGNRVDWWFLTHPHIDHIGALTEILKDPGELHIQKIYGSFPDLDWIEPLDMTSYKALQEFNEAIEKSGHSRAEFLLGSEFWIDSLKVQVLGVKNTEITENAINNSSVVLRMSDSEKSVLFLGDLGVEGGRKLLERVGNGELKSDYVQMAHHGQNGVEEEVYKAIEASYCLWTTPIWLWNNDRGHGKGTGPWLTLEVRGWMENLDIKAHYVTSLDGLVKID